ncbi:MAG: adenylate cyclase [Chloroflexota bacterium]|nr:adenylate cyclase [Chloroflexota bacterium]
MSSAAPPSGAQSADSAASSEERWRHLLVDQAPFMRSRRLHARLPSSPRCKLCAAPFAGPGGIVMRFFGHARWTKNPKYCTGCFGMLSSNHGGAEVECSLLFADVRGSTTLAESMSPRAFNRLMGRFHDTATDVLVDHDGIVDKFVGDEIIGIFVPAMASPQHAARAVDAARTLLTATGFGTPAGAWVPIGIGVNTGVAYVGSIGDGSDTEMTAMGDVVNVTARLSSVAAAGEVLVTTAAAAAAGLPGDLPRRSLQLKGKSQPTDVVVVTGPQ